MSTEPETPNQENAPETSIAPETSAAPATRGLRAAAAVRWVLVVLAATLAAFSWWSFAAADPQAESAARYYCPMHPEITSRDPGECPICHMTLEPIPESRKQPKKPAKARPAKKAPPSDHAGHDHAAMTAAEPAGVTDVELLLDRVQAIGVRTTEAERAPGDARLRAPAVVETPESGVARVHARASGFIERIAVNETGVKVRAGQELVALYSPEIYEAELELLTVRRWSDQASSKDTEAQIRKKLELLGVSSRTVERIVEKGEAQRAVSISAPIAGFVTKKEVVLGSYVKPEALLFEIVDLSKVYVIASLYDDERARLGVGVKGTFRSSGKPDRAFSAEVDLVYPEVDVNARTARVRLQVATPEASLFPGEYGTVEFEVPGSESVVVPRDALIDTGLATYVFVAEGKGRFSPRTVEVGGSLGTDRLKLRGGVKAGERVVSGATFLIDSESRLRASLAAEDDAP